MTKQRLVVEGYIRRPQATGRRNAPASAMQAQMESAAARRGWHVVRALEDCRYPQLRDQALLRIESGEIDGLIVERLSDLGSSLADAVASIDRIKAAGGTLLSISEGIELGPHTGALIWRLLVALADYQ